MANHSTSNLQGLNHDSLRKRRCHKEDSIEAAENLSFRISATDMVAERNNNKPVSWKKNPASFYTKTCVCMQGMRAVCVVSPVQIKHLGFDFRDFMLSSSVQIKLLGFDF